ncbi:acyl-CoA thioester hydrolase [Piscibacillus halophilus]|uniref:Acyl-CoA thioester hydrolase n=2 Tax=Piscibacillus halophilus TaxID=571933 RepID=A0A1H9L2A3_9BACI|nr:acyl-CoA thioester hydrolase [Piscibacillus halophilus]
MMIPLDFSIQVKEEWVDYNQHMNDAVYAKVFSQAGYEMMLGLGISREKLEQHEYTYFTLETHLCYLKEALLGEVLHLEWQLIDYDSKRLHVFLKMMNANGEPIATSEQMIIGVDSRTRKSAPFPEEFLSLIEQAWSEHQHMIKPEQVGKVIGIKRQK